MIKSRPLYALKPLPPFHAPRLVISHGKDDADSGNSSKISEPTT
jgi:hypothetical protein